MAVKISPTSYKMYSCLQTTFLEIKKKVRSFLYKGLTFIKITKKEVDIISPRGFQCQFFLLQSITLKGLNLSSLR